MNNSEQRRHVVKCVKDGTYYLSAISPGDLSEISEESLELPFLNPKHKTIGSSCGGLLLIFDCKGHLFLCNPTTKQFQFFESKYKEPSPDCFFDSRADDFPFFKTAGLGYDSKSDDYKIVRVYESFNTENPRRVRYETDVYSLNKNRWKNIGSTEHFIFSHAAIYVNGSCYWVSDGSRVISFDFSEESFSHFPLPSKTEDEVGRFLFNFELVKLDGDGEDLLGAIWYRERGSRFSHHYHGVYFELWVWRRERCEWDKNFNVSLTGVYTPQAMIDNRFLFLDGIYLTGTQDDYRRDCIGRCRLVVYDCTRAECKELGIIYDSSTRVNVFSYVESTLALPDGKPIYGSHVLNTDNSLGNNDDDIECTPDCPTKVLDNIDKEMVDDFKANGIRIIDDDTEEVIEETTRYRLLSSL